MKSNGNAFYVNSGKLARNLLFEIADADEKKVQFFATASRISRTSRFNKSSLPKKSVLAFFYSSKSISLIDYIMFTLIIKYQIIVKSWE